MSFIVRFQLVQIREHENQILHDIWLPHMGIDMDTQIMVVAKPTCGNLLELAKETET